MLNAGRNKLTILLVAVLILSLGIMCLNGTFANGELTFNGEKKNVENGKDYKVSVTYQRDSGNNSKKYTLEETDKGTFLPADISWCPGRTEIFYLTVKNEEKFPVRCTLSMVADDSDLSKAFSYAVINNLKQETSNHPTDWNAFTNSAAIKGNLIPDDQNQSLPIFSINPLFENEQCFALAIHMNEDATSELMKQKMELSFTLKVDAIYEPGATPSTADSSKS